MAHQKIFGLTLFVTLILSCVGDVTVTFEPNNSTTADAEVIKYGSQPYSEREPQRIIEEQVYADDEAHRIQPIRGDIPMTHQNIVEEEKPPVPVCPPTVQPQPPLLPLPCTRCCAKRIITEHQIPGYIFLPFDPQPFPTWNWLHPPQSEQLITHFENNHLEVIPGYPYFQQIIHLPHPQPFPELPPLPSLPPLPELPPLQPQYIYIPPAPLPALPPLPHLSNLQTLPPLPEFPLLHPVFPGFPTGNQHIVTTVTNENVPCDK